MSQNNDLNFFRSNTNTNRGVLLLTRWKDFSHKCSSLAPFICLAALDFEGRVLLTLSVGRSDVNDLLSRGFGP